jgi:hypothetical protein
MNKNNFSTEDVLATSQMNQIRGGGALEDMRAAYTSAKGTPVSSTGTIAKPTSVRGDELVAKTISTVSSIGTAVGATAQDIYIATTVALAGLPYVR